VQIHVICWFKNDWRTVYCIGGVDFWIFNIHTYLPIWRKPNFLTLFTDFFLFWARNIHFWAGRHETKEKRLFYFGLSSVVRYWKSKKSKNRLPLQYNIVGRILPCFTFLTKGKLRSAVHLVKVSKKAKIVSWVNRPLSNRCHNYEESSICFSHKWASLCWILRRF
jgi:hypothetical protein